MDCRQKCGACCIAPSISSKIPGMPSGKGSGVPCVHLDADYRCLIYSSPERPAVCANLLARFEMCGNTRDEALEYLTNLEINTSP